MAGVSATVAAAQPSDSPRASVVLLACVISLFFIWGGITSLNDILIPKLKGLFQLSYTQAMLTQFAFFTAYAVISLPAGFLVARSGYGRGMATGLVIMATGCLLFVPAAQMASYPLFLAALFVLASGITILQVAANPLIATLGPAQTSHSRLTFAQAFNSLGTAIWPYIGAQLILGSVADVDPSTLSGEALFAFQTQEAAVIGRTYVGIAIVLAAMALAFWYWRARLGAAGTAVGLAGSGALLRERRLMAGVAAIFLYVGAEVTIGSLLANFLMQPSTMNLPERSAGEHVALYWTGAMVGRFVGALLLRVVSPGKLLSVFALCAVMLILAAVSLDGKAAGWVLILVGLTNSVMFPTIFSLALEGLGEKSAQGSGLLCMAIVGGALVPLLAGTVADAFVLSAALFIPAACYLLIAAFGWYVRSAARISSQVAGA
jgi:FHS family L-fucose permease-like MFS transporter